MFIPNKNQFKFNYNFNLLHQKQKQEHKKWMWIVLIGCFLLQMLPYCIGVNLAKSFAGNEWLIWVNGNSTLIGLAFTIGTICASFIGPFIAKLFNKEISMRLIYGIGVCAATLGFATFSINAFLSPGTRSVPIATTVLWSGNIISQVGVVIFSGLGINNLINKWWPNEKRGFALGIAFAGGSFGNIWMQPLVGEFVKLFGNSPTTFEQYDENQLQYWTYLIIALIGLFLSILIVFFACKKPLPPIITFQENIKTQTTNPTQDVSILNTKKYPIYWIMFFGYMLIQMGAVHASQSGLIFRNYTLTANDMTSKYTYFNQITGIVFGIACLIGNAFGGILSEKIKPNRAIFLAGSLQVSSCIVMLYSIYEPNLIYLYMILSGLGVYIYTSMPSFLCGKLFGKGYSNSHTAFLGIFTGIGFALSNSLYGSITGNINTPHEFFGKTTNGNISSLLIYCLVLLVLGTLIVTLCSTIILNKGIKGLLEYSPTKYSQVITFKHGLKIYLLMHYFIWFKKGVYNIEIKFNKNKYLHSKRSYFQLIKANTRKILNKNQQLILLNLFWSNSLPNSYSRNDLYFLINHNYVSIIKNYYQINSNWVNSLKAKNQNEWFFNNYNNFQKQLDNNDRHIAFILDKLTTKNNYKIQKLEQKIKLTSKLTIDANKQIKNEIKANTRIKKLKKLETQIVNNNKLDEWSKYEKEYDYLLKIDNANNLKNKLQNDISNKIAKYQRKIFISNYIYEFDKKQQIEGYELLKDYYLHQNEHLNQLINHRLKLYYETRGKLK